MSAPAPTHRSPHRIAVVGCGNPNRSDDGAGIHAVRLLKAAGVEDCGTREPGAGSVAVFDAGTDGMAVMFAARGSSSLIIVDACSSRGDPGAIFEVPGAELEGEHEAAMNLHDFRWNHALHAGRKIYGDDFPTDVTVFLIEARSLALGLELSPEVEAAASHVTARIRALVRERIEREVLP
jgi:hydrogenase maturation protease